MDHSNREEFQQIEVGFELKGPKLGEGVYGSTWNGQISSQLIKDSWMGTVHFVGPIGPHLVADQPKFLV